MTLKLLPPLPASLPVATHRHPRRSFLFDTSSRPPNFCALIEPYVYVRVCVLVVFNFFVSFPSLNLFLYRIIPHIKPIKSKNNSLDAEAAAPSFWEKISKDFRPTLACACVASSFICFVPSKLLAVEHRSHSRLLWTFFLLVSNSVFRKTLTASNTRHEFSRE